MTQTFQGPVRDVAGRDVIHQYACYSRSLTRSERSTLNNLVRQLHHVFGASERTTWKLIYSILGINSSQLMHLEHYKPAETILLLMLENADLHHNFSSAENFTSFHILFNKSDTTFRSRISYNNLLAKQRKIARQANAKLEAPINQNIGELRGIVYKLQRKIDEITLPYNICSQCKAAPKSSNQRSWLFGLTTVIAVASLSAIFFVINAQSSTVKNKNAIDQSRLCQFEDMHYSIGSVVSGEKSFLLRCEFQGTTMAPRWRAMPSADEIDRTSARTGNRVQPARTIFSEFDDQVSANTL